MSERPVEKLIGWHPGAKGRAWFDAHGNRYVRAEVDDLAAWLFDAAGDFHLAPYPGRGWWVLGIFPKPPFGPTVRDALVAAVRRVAEQ